MASTLKFARVSAAMPQPAPSTVENVYRLAQELSPIASVLFRIIRDERGVCVDLEWVHQNDAAARFNRLPSRSGCAGVRMLERSPSLRGSALWTGFERVARTGLPWQDEIYRAGDGMDRWFRVTAVRPDRQTVAVFFEDIHDRKTAESEIAAVVQRERTARAEVTEERLRFEALIANAPIPIALLRGPDLRYGIANRAYLGLFFDRELAGRTLREAQPELGPPGVIEVFERVYSTGERFEAKEAPIDLPSPGGVNEKRYFDFAVQALRDGRGQIDGLLAFGIEVTHQVRARHAAEEASRTKDEFLAMLGHELRNPLSPILTALHLMRLKGGAELTREQKIIERQIAHLVRLVDDLLDMSRITRGKLELRRQRVELDSVVREAIETASPLLEPRRQHLAVAVPRRGLTILGDTVRLTQVVANLLTNAAKYSNPGGNIDIRATREGDEVVLRVSDDGIGIAPDMLATVFDSFTQGPQALDRAQGGLGLGLAIVKSLVKLHGGTVHARSDGRGRGSEFTVRLPIASEGEGEDHDMDGAASRAEGVQGAARGSVLIVDDNEDSAEMLSEALAALGYRPRVANDAIAALKLVECELPEIAVLDIGLPVMDGYELARRLRAGPGGTELRLVAITGYGQERDILAARAAGFDAHLVKPVDLERLQMTLADFATAR